MAEKKIKVGDVAIVDGARLTVAIVGASVALFDDAALACGDLVAEAREAGEHGKLSTISRGTRVKVNVRNLRWNADGKAWSIPGRLLSRADRLRWRAAVDSKYGPSPENEVDARDYLAFLDEKGN